jgi:hypothetical protein
LKKALILLAVVVLCACAGGLFGQETHRPYSYTFKGGVCVFTGVTFDQVWAAMKKAFTTQDIKGGGSWSGRTAGPGRPSNRMRGPWVIGHGRNAYIWRLNILVEQRADGVGIDCGIIDITSDSAPSTEGVWDSFCRRVAELLYGKVEKK